jgi:uncharacterized membrane protein YGL010W
VKTAVQQLTKYASYHRDQRNIITHFIGVPMIVFSVVVFLSRPAMTITGFPGLPVMLSPALVTALVACVYYLMLDFKLGAVMVAVFALFLWLAQPIATASTQSWLMTGALFFIIGWIIQFIGHYYEGKKPAFVDDIMGLMIGPLFVAAELAFLLGTRKALQKEIEKDVGPVYLRKLA